MLPPIVRKGIVTLGVFIAAMVILYFLPSSPLMKLLLYIAGFGAVFIFIKAYFFGMK